MDNTNQQDKKKFKVTDKMVYIVLIAGICFMVALYMLAPRFIAYKLTKDPRALKESPGVTIMKHITSAIAGNAGLEKAIQEQKMHEQEWLAQFPEEIRNKQFATTRERIDFFTNFAKEYGNRKNTEALSEEEQTRLKAAANLINLYNAEEFLEQSRTAKSEQKPATQN